MARNKSSFVERLKQESGETHFEFDPDEINYVKHDVADLLGPTRKDKSSNQLAAEWRLRCRRSVSIFNELDKLGTLATLTSGGLLLSTTATGIVKPLERSSRWKATLMSSTMFTKLSVGGQQCLLEADYEPYTRIESGISAFGQMICLAVDDLDDQTLVQAFDKFKVWCVEHAFTGPKANDDVLGYIKWLCKIAQSWLLKSQFPEMPSLHPDCSSGLIPFVGQLAFISDAYFADKRRSEQLKLKDARALAQIANTPRAMPYPSKDQTCASVEETVETFMKEGTVDERTLSAYRKALAGLVDQYDVPERKTSHGSLVGSGSFENSRKNGGRSKYLIGCAKRTTDVVYDPDDPLIKDMIGKFDQFGFVILAEKTLERASILFKNTEYKRPPTLAELLYVREADICELWENSLNGNKRLVPRNLGHILNASASKLMLEVGSFTEPHEIVNNYLCFDKQDVEFKLEGLIKVKADVSIEAGMKTRLITAATVGFAHLSQLPANYMRKWLSQDEFVRTGFLEADKLWDCLKTYGKS